MKFVLRDDDVSFFTQPLELEEAYGKIWPVVPVSMAVIPFASSIYHIFLMRSQELFDFKTQLSYLRTLKSEEVKKLVDEKHPLENNRPIVEYLKEKVGSNNIEILLHGYDHRITSEGYEYQRHDENLAAKTEKGKRYLEMLFDTHISVFVPPNNFLGRDGLNALAVNKLSFLSTKYPSWNMSNIVWLKAGTTFALAFMLLGRINRNKLLRYPHVINYRNGVRQFLSVSLSEDIDFIYLQLKYAAQRKGNICLYTHSHELYHDLNKREKLKKIIDVAANKYSCEFVKSEKLFLTTR